MRTIWRLWQTWGLALRRNVNAVLNSEDVKPTRIKFSFNGRPVQITGLTKGMASMTIGSLKFALGVERLFHDGAELFLDARVLTLKGGEVLTGA
jgi:hypothetical protein